MAQDNLKSNVTSQKMLSFKTRPSTAPTYKTLNVRQGVASDSNGGNPSFRQNNFLQISRGQYQFDKHKNAEPTSNISSMRDIHKIYEPPIPKHLIPTNNPFYNKSLVG